MNLLEAGLKYLKRGFPVIPFRRDKKGSAIKTWEPYQKVLPSESDVKGWFEKRFSHEFMAIVTGKLSRIMVVDCDSEEAYQRVQENLPESLETPVAKSPKGYHIYFQYREGLFSRRYMPEVDVKTDGGCIIVPPSQNGDGKKYKWLTTGIDKADPAVMPDSLYYLLLQLSSSYKGHDDKEENDSRQVSSLSPDVVNLFVEGQRNQDIFHVANCLFKGGCEKKYINKVCEIIGKNCNPPINEKEISTIIQSAMDRKKSREGNLAADIRDFVLSSTGVFLSSNVAKCLQLSSRDELKNLSKALNRLKLEGIIEKAGNRDGEWRLIDQSCQPMDWINADCSYLPLWMPLRLGEICGVQPGNILVFAGAKDSGKTAFLMNIAKENRHKYKVHYFNSEMGASEFKLRAGNFDDISVQEWRDVFVYERSENFQDVIKPGEGNLNIIDYLEVVDEFWKVASTIQKIHQKLNGALCVVGLQKNPNVDLGRGGAFSLEKARLYVSLDYQHAKIVSCKNFVENEMIRGSPRGYTCKYKLFKGCKITKQPPGWTSPAESEEK